MALQWIQRNVGLFGGNARNVTIFGESAGGSSVLFHMVMPKSYGLYARVIAQSAAIFAETIPKQQAEDFGQTVVSKTQCSVRRSSFICVCQYQLLIIRLQNRLRRTRPF
jgi:carboxylesterase type B